MATTMNCGLGTLHSACSRRHNGEHIHSPTSKLLVSELRGRSRLLRVSCKSRSVDVLELNKTENQSYDGVIYQKGRESDDAVLNQWTCVVMFGGSLASAERVREVAHLIRSFLKERLELNKTEICSMCVSHLEELEQLLKGIAQVKELTLRTKDYLVSFGVCMSTRIFAAYLNKVGVKACQYDAFEIGFRTTNDFTNADILEATYAATYPAVVTGFLGKYDAFEFGFVTTDDFTNADILEATYPAVAKRLHNEWVNDPAIPVVTSFFGKGLKSCAITTLGRGGRDLTAGAIGKALGLREFQVNAYSEYTAVKLQMVASVFFSVAGDDSERKPTSDNVKADKKPTFNPFKEIKSTEDWMKFVGVLHFGSSVMINQLILDKRVQLVGVLKVGETMLLNSAWFTKNVSALVLIALALKLVMDDKSLDFSWILKLKEGGAATLMELLKRPVDPPSNDRTALPPTALVYPARNQSMQFC
ncbi:hypothetical protein Vadar_001098 [Vaccinium darrowii]|uniref:Uncharacterized protein n=1 Tax=Vaccinium darrowii TaxID=229202 RepID=A0ACB7YCE7_9ERIC|nr:hypothetical protein Vadar_001098 [Vaccinium darrowii]